LQIEILLQTSKSEDKKLVESIFTILYATEDDFEIPGEAGAGPVNHSSANASQEGDVKGTESFGDGEGIENAHPDDDLFADA
jgi:hypothetical protein